MIVTYVSGRVVRRIAIDRGSSIRDLVAAQLLDHDEDAEAEVVVLDDRGHRLERWVRTADGISRVWSLPGVVAEAGRRPSSNPPPPR